MSNSIEAEKGATAPSVVAGLGYPNGRQETSPKATGWRASAVNPDGSADQSTAIVTAISGVISEAKG